MTTTTEFTTLGALRGVFAQQEGDAVAPTANTTSARASVSVTASAAPAPWRVSVRGQFVRKRKLSKGLIFGDLLLDDDELLEVMIRASPDGGGGGLSIAAIRQINWDVHLGDRVIIDGVVTRKSTGPLLLSLVGVRVLELWSEAHPGEFFDHTRYDREHERDPEKNATKEATESGSGASGGTGGSLALAPSSQAAATDKYTNIVQIHGFNACKYYFAGAQGGNCRRGAQCHFWHGDPAEYAANRRLWLARREEQRRAASAIDGDAHDPEAKRLKGQRARIFCDWLVEQLGMGRLGQGTGVIDVAGGKGDIPLQLWNTRGIPTTLIDPRPMKLTKKHRKFLETPRARAASDETARTISSNETDSMSTTSTTVGAAARRGGLCPQLRCCLTEETVAAHPELFAQCSVLVGMHPDEATEAIVDVALQLRRPFAIVPCCVMSRQFPDRRCADGSEVATYEAFVRYLLEKDPRIQRAFLSFTGRNQVLYLFDYEQ